MTTVLLVLAVFLVASIFAGMLTGRVLHRHVPPPTPEQPQYRAVNAIDQTGDQVDRDVFPPRS